MTRIWFLSSASLAALCLIAGASSGDVPATPASSPALPTPALCVSRPGGSVVPASLAEWANGAQLFDGLGDFHRKVTTGSETAQAYFDQGMRYLWAFNHDESTRSFAKAATLDPACAMCFWGVALTVGPNYNLPMMAEARAKVAWQALQQAKAQAARATPVEQALIAALAERYPNPQPLDPSNGGPVLTAYAHSMQDVARSFPDDVDVKTLAAEALMTTNAWKLWALDGTPADGTGEIVVLLQDIMAKRPQHPGANHYYIHAVEASPHPELAVAAAERLPGMMPAAGHLEHMPAHIMQRVGRYADAAEANRKGAAADQAYFAKTTPLDYYAMYTGHNYQFLAYSTVMQGRKAETLDAARKSRAVVSDDLAAGMPGIDWYLTELYATMVRFGMWDEILAEVPPNPKLPGLAAGYLYARTAALAAKARIEEAQTDLQALEKINAAATADDAAGLNAARDVFTVAVLVARARIAAAQDRSAETIALLTEATAKEDALAYDEPSDWFVPVRHLLGPALLRAGQAREAEVVYREDLRRHPENGWALYGLTQSLAAQHKDAEAQDTRRRFDAAWKNADVALTNSAF
jgi:hypothetical protein